MQNKLTNQWSWLILLLAILFPFPTAMAAGSIATDGTVGPAQSLNGINVTISQNLGTTVGKNLFHSFEQFNVNTGQTVTFTENTPNALDNVISRVTGGSASAIDGTLRSTPGGHANLYLVNPSGVMFGPNAKIDVPGAFHASTADEVRFQDGAKFSASQPAGSTLTAAAPASFGFLGMSSATNGLLKVDGAQLVVKPGQKLDMVGRNISVDNGGKLTAPEGEVRLEAVGQGSMNIPLNQPSEAAHGALALTKSTIDASGAVGGKVFIRGGDLKMSQNAEISANTKDKKNGTEINVHLTGDMLMEDGSAISARTSGSGNGGDIDVAVQGDMAVKGGSTIDASTSSSGDAGNIHAKANNLLVDGQTILNGQTKYALTNIDSTTNFGKTLDDKAGNAGNITLDINNQLALIRGGRLISSAFGTGNAGNITVNAGQLVIDGQGDLKDINGNPLQTRIASSAAETFSGKGGDIAVAVRGNMTVKGGGIINASTFGSGAAGNIQVTANNLLIDRQGATDNKSESTGIFNHTVKGLNGGKGGNIAVAVRGDMTMKGGGTISASTSGSGAAGNILVTANNLLIDGLTASNGQLSYEETDIVSDAQPGSTGNAGNITLDIANRLDLIRGGKISSTTFTFGKGAGSVTVDTGQLLIDRQGATDNKGEPVLTGIFSQVTKGSSVKGGDIAVAVRGDMTMKGGGTISAKTSGSGKGGDITVAVQGNMAVEGGSAISASTLGSGAAGNIQVTANNLLIDGLTASNGQPSYEKTDISSDAEPGSTGNAGNITLDIANRLDLIRGGQISSSAFGSGDASSVMVNTGQLLIDRQGGMNSKGEPIQTAIFSQAVESFSGKCGNIGVAVRGDMTLKGGGEIDASTFGPQNGGNIHVKANNLLIDGQTILNGQKRYFLTGIESTAGSGEGPEKTGNGGNIILDIPGRLELNRDGVIRTSALSMGNAGNIMVNAGQLLIDGQSVTDNSENSFSAGILTEAPRGWSGTGGDITVTVRGDMAIKDSGIITTLSSGKGDAGNITVNAKQLTLDQKSLISTEADNSNGGNITINGGQFVQLINSGIKTSVHGQQGNSGNITINADNLVMETGLIQANTEALGGSAGTINLHIKELIPSGQSLFTGGIQETPWAPDVFGLNVIEAVAPNGISGLVQSTAPQLDLSGVLSNLGMPQFDTRAISQDYCSLGTGSSLIRQGKGGLPPRSRDSVQY